MCPSPFFIVGSDRSGTTMLRLMLNVHSQVHVPRESWFLIELMDKLPLSGALTLQQVMQAGEIITQHRRWPDWNITDSALIAALEKLRAPTLAQLIDAVFRLSAQQDNKPLWADKTPEYVIRIADLHRVFPKAKFIHVIRDGRDVCLSLLKTGWRGQTIRQISAYWSDYVLRGHAASTPLGPDLYREVRYEDLVLDTEGELRSLCGFLNLSFEPQMLEFWKTSAQQVAGWEG